MESLDESTTNDDEQMTYLDSLEDTKLHEDEQDEESERIRQEKLTSVIESLRALGYSQRVIDNVRFELQHKSISRETRRTIDKVQVHMRQKGAL